MSSLCASHTRSQTPTPPAPPGTLVDIDGRWVHIYCTGHGSPTVVVTSGGFSFDWGLVQPSIAQLTRICTYDTAGTAWSDPAPGENDPTCSNRVAELHKLLSSAGITAPYIMVGFSLGGLIARLYTAEYPNEIAGIVFVDHAFVDTAEGKPADAQTQAPAAGLDSPPVLISKTPIELDLEDDRNFSRLPGQDQKLHRWALSIHSARPPPEMAARCFVEVATTEGRAQYPLGNKPVAVVSTLNDSPGYADLQKTLLVLSRNSEQFIAADSSHMVIIDQPGIVVRAIEATLNAVRSGAPLKK